MFRTVLGVIFAIFFLAACTINTKGVPPRISRIESKMASAGNHVGYAYSAFVSSTPLATLTGSASHVIGGPSLEIEASNLEVYSSEHNAPALIFGIFDEGCHLPAGVADELRRVLDEVFSKVDQNQDWKKIKVRLDLFPSGYSVADKEYALRPGREVALRFLFPCSSGAAATDILNAYLTGLHETSHVLFQLVKLDHREDLKPWSLGQELLAEGLPACIFEEFKKADPLQLFDTVPEEDYFSRNWQTARLALKGPSILCIRWIEAMNGKLMPG